MNIHATPADLCDWIAASHKGDRFTYHLGNLVHDRRYRVLMATSGTYQTIDNLSLQTIAKAAMDAYLDGYVVLAQERVGEDIFRYQAIRTGKYRKPPLATKEKLK